MIPKRHWKFRLKVYTRAITPSDVFLSYIFSPQSVILSWDCFGNFGFFFINIQHVICIVGKRENSRWRSTTTTTLYNRGSKLHSSEGPTQWRACPVLCKRRRLGLFLMVWGGKNTFRSSLHHPWAAVFPHSVCHPQKNRENWAHRYFQESN